MFNLENWQKNPLSIEDNYHSVCYKVTKKGVELPIYILGSFHKGLPPSVEPTINNFINDIRPSIVYFEGFWSSLPMPGFYNTEYYVHKSAEQIGSSFKGLESIWYQLLNVSPKVYLFGLPVQSRWMQRFTKQNPFLGYVIGSTLNGLFHSAAFSSMTAFKGRKYIMAVYYMHLAYLKLNDFFTIAKARDAYIKAFKFPILSSWMYWLLDKSVALDVRNQDWLKRVIIPRFEGKTEETDESYFYSLLNILAGLISQVGSVLCYVGKALCYVPLMMARFLLTAIGLDPSLASPFSDDPFKPLPTQEGGSQQSLNDIYQDYLLFSNERKKLTFYEFVNQYQLDASDLDKSQNDAYGKITTGMTADPKCSELYVVGAAHLRTARESGVIDLLAKATDQDGTFVYAVEAIDLNQYKPNQPLILTKIKTHQSVDDREALLMRTRRVA